MFALHISLPTITDTNLKEAQPNFHLKINKNFYFLFRVTVFGYSIYLLLIYLPQHSLSRQTITGKDFKDIVNIGNETEP